MMRVAVVEYLSAGGDDVPAALLAEGCAMRDAVAADVAAVRGATVTVAMAAGHFCSPGHAAMAPAGTGGTTARAAQGLDAAVARSGETPARFAGRLAATHDAVWAIAPETGGALAAMCDAVPPSRWLGCSPAAIRLAGSKRATLARLHAAGVSTPLAFTDRPSGWVVKPDDGAGSDDTRWHAERAAAMDDRSARAAQGRGRCANRGSRAMR